MSMICLQISYFFDQQLCFSKMQERKQIKLKLNRRKATISEQRKKYLLSKSLSLTSKKHQSKRKIRENHSSNPPQFKHQTLRPVSSKKYDHEDGQDRCQDLEERMQKKSARQILANQEINILMKKGELMIVNDRARMSKKTLIELLGDHLFQMKALKKQISELKTTMKKNSEEDMRQFLRKVFPFQSIEQQTKFCKSSRLQNCISFVRQNQGEKKKQEFQYKLWRYLKSLFCKEREENFSLTERTQKLLEQKEQLCIQISELKKGLCVNQEKINSYISQIQDLKEEKQKYQDKIKNLENIWVNQSYYIEQKEDLIKKLANKLEILNKNFMVKIKSSAEKNNKDDLLKLRQTIQSSYEQYIYMMKKSILCLSSKLKQFYMKISDLEAQERSLMKNIGEIGIKMNSLIFDQSQFKNMKTDIKAQINSSEEQKKWKKIFLFFENTSRRVKDIQKQVENLKD